MILSGGKMRSQILNSFVHKFRATCLPLLLVGMCWMSLPAVEGLACPMCKTATEAAGDDRQPAAYMASILTMLSMPTVLFTVIGVALYRVSRSEQMVADELDSSSHAD